MSATKKSNTIRLHNQLTVAAHGDERVERRHAVEVEVRRAYREEEHPGEDRAEPDEAVPHYRGAAGGVVEHLGGNEKMRDAIGDGKRRSGGGGGWGAVAGSYGYGDETLSVVAVQIRPTRTGGSSAIPSRLPSWCDPCRCSHERAGRLHGQHHFGRTCLGAGVQTKPVNVNLPACRAHLNCRCAIAVLLPPPATHSSKFIRDRKRKWRERLIYTTKWRLRYIGRSRQGSRPSPLPSHPPMDRTAAPTRPARPPWTDCPPSPPPPPGRRC